ncbi:MAG: M28 family peptidase [Bacteroidales bacterium]
MTKQFLNLCLFIFTAAAIISCEGNAEEKKIISSEIKHVKEVDITSIPEFNVDSAYNYMAKQISFGPRNPGSKGRDECAIWLLQKIKNYADTAFFQEFKTRSWEGNIFDGKNIIASFNPEKKRRLLLSAHYDTRPYSDQDPDKANYNKPLDGANDGASGTGVLLEIARILKTKKANIGIDIIFWDMEDYGPPSWTSIPEEDRFWALGSQYWANNPHKQNYNAKYAILLDMVGGENNVFPREYFSQEFAPEILDYIWDIAAEIGYSNYFVNEEGLAVNDDHLPLNNIAGIPTIDIIGMDKSKGYYTFYKYWHTQNDKLDNISKKTLNAVGQVVTTVVYKEK